MYVCICNTSLTNSPGYARLDVERVDKLSRAKCVPQVRSRGQRTRRRLRRRERRNFLERCEDGAGLEAENCTSHGTSHALVAILYSSQRTEGVKHARILEILGVAVRSERGDKQSHRVSDARRTVLSESLKYNREFAIHVVT